MRRKRPRVTGKALVTHLRKANRHEFFQLAVRPVSGRAHIPGVGVVHVTLPPRYTHQAIYHRRTREWMFILKGTGNAVLGRRIVRLRPGSIVYIPPGMMHQMSTQSSAIEALVLFSPPMSMDERRMDVCR